MKSFLLKDIIIIITWNSDTYTYSSIPGMPPSSSDAPLLLCILKNILRSLLALSISMVLFRILNPVPVLAAQFFFFLANRCRNSTSVVCNIYAEHIVLNPDVYIQQRLISRLFHSHKSMFQSILYRNRIIIDGSMSFISTSLATWN